MKRYYVHNAIASNLKPYKNGNLRLFVNHGSAVAHKEFQKLVINWLIKNDISYETSGRKGMWRTIWMNDSTLEAVKKQFPRGRFTPFDYNVTLPPQVSISLADQVEFYMIAKWHGTVTGRQVMAWLRKNNKEYVSYTNFADSRTPPRKKYIVSKDTFALLIMFFPEIKLVVVR